MSNYLPSLLLGTLLMISGSALAQTQPTALSELPVQTPTVNASAENSRLRQMESIYQQQLRTRHIPLLGQYLSSLHQLAERATDPAPYQHEIQRIQAIIASGGVVDLSAAFQSLRLPAEIPVSPSVRTSTRRLRAPLTLTPSTARNISPLPLGGTKPETAAIGEIEWQIESLPAGTHEVVMLYSCPNIDTPVTGHFELGDHRINVTLDELNGTATASSFRVLRLGQMILPEDIQNEVLRLKFDSITGSPRVIVKQLIITRSKTSP